MNRAAHIVLQWMRRGAGVMLALVLLVPCARAQVNERPAFLDEVGLEEKLGAPIPLHLSFKDSQGRTVSLAQYFDDGRPVVLALVYYRCPVICTMILEQMVESFNGLDYTIGEQFNVVCLSFDERENPTIALAKKNEIVSQYARGMGPGVMENWAFLTGDPESVRQVADAIGFRYKRLDNGEYAHPIAFAVLSPEGAVSRYFYGYEYPPKQMKLALLEASEGKVAQSFGDRILHFCYRFDPNEGAYTLQAMRVMQLGGVVTMVGLGALIGGLLIRERRRAGAARKSEQDGGAREKHSALDGAGRHAAGAAGQTS